METSGSRFSRLTFSYGLTDGSFGLTPVEAHAHLIGLLERKECNFDRLAEWIGDSVVSQ